jgi:hypothetical protein
MNPLMVLFFVAIFLEDFLFREAKLFKYLIYSVMAYWIFYSFNEKSAYHSASRKLLLASYSQSYDPTVYAKIRLDVKNAKIYIAKLEQKLGKKISWTLFLTKCIANIFKRHSKFNQSIIFGAYHAKKSSDFSVLVDVGGKVY